MQTLPAAIETAIHHQLLTPLSEVLAGQRPARDIEIAASDDVVLRLTLGRRRPLGPITVRTIRAQRVATREAIEITASLTDATGLVHPLGVRVEQRGGRALITAVATDLWRT